MAKTKSTNAGESAVVEQTKCPMTQEEFVKNAKPITVVINGETKVATPKVFATGSFGWYLGEKIVITVGGDNDGAPLRTQIGMNLIVVGSNPTKNGK